MGEGQAQTAFAALAQETRLRIVRMLVKAGPDGMAAGALAEAFRRVAPPAYRFTSRNSNIRASSMQRREARSNHLQRRL